MGSRDDWKRQRHTMELVKNLEQRAAQALRRLIAAASTSSDGHVRHAVAQYEVATSLVTELKGSKDDDAEV